MKTKTVVRKLITEGKMTNTLSSEPNDGRVRWWDG